MYRRIVTAAMASVLSWSATGSLHAAPMLFHHAGSASASTGKMVSFNVRNDAKTTLVVKAGDQQFTIEPGKTQSLKLQEGAQLINEQPWPYSVRRLRASSRLIDRPRRR